MTEKTTPSTHTEQIPSGFDLLHTFGEHGGTVYSMAWSPDGRMFASGATDSAVRLWDVQSGELRRTLEGYYGNTDTITWSLDGRILASGAWNETIHLLNAETGLETTTLRGHTNRILCIRFSPDGRVLASKSKDDAIRCWRCDTWELIAVLTELSSPIFGGLAFHPHDPVLATRGERGNSIHIWQLDYNVLLPPTTSADTQLDRDEEFILVSDSSDFTVGTVTSEEKPEGGISQKIVPEASPLGLELLHTFGGSDVVICDIAWSPDGRILASGSTDYTVHLRDSQNGKLLRTLKGHSDTIDSVLWSPDGHTLASGSADHTICLWNSESGELIHTLKGHHAGVLSLTWSPDGQILADDTYSGHSW